jgi:hypothetical protein
VSVESFVLVLCVGAALLALWLVVRFPDLGPGDMTRALLHVAVSAVLIQVMVGAIHLVSRSGLPAPQFLAAFGVVLPGLTYTFLAAAWMIRSAATRLHGRY